LLVASMMMMPADEYSVTIIVTMVTLSSIGDVITVIKCCKETYNDTIPYIVRGKYFAAFVDSLLSTKILSSKNLV